MSESPRPIPREAFLLGEKVLEVFFHTSNIDKYLQARAVFDRVGLRLQHFRSNTEPYAEDYSLGKARLLTRAIDEVKARVGRGMVFFVEDTSLRIEALSGNEDVPGLAVKEWFRATAFADLDSLLIGNGGDRRAVVKSDIALHLPGLRRPVMFHGETAGQVAQTPPSFAPSVQHPWLTPHTFNGWFVPDGAVKRLGAMSFEESWKHDFRVRAMLDMITRLEEYAIILNISPPAYVRRARLGVAGQQTLWRSDRQIVVVVGRTCAGKTTFAERAADAHGFRYLEASGLLRMLAEGAVDPSLTAFEAAGAFLSANGADVVARKVVEIIGMETDRNVVISGFRTVEELDVLKRAVPEARVVLTEASERTRFERHLARGRLDGDTSLEAFRRLERNKACLGCYELPRTSRTFASSMRRAWTTSGYRWMRSSPATCSPQ